MRRHKRDDVLRANESFPLYRPAELAEMLGITPDLLARWRARGGGPKFICEARNLIVYLKSDVNAWLRKRRRDRLTYPKKKTAARKREAVKRAKRAATIGVLKREAQKVLKRRRTTRADSPAPTESPGA